MSSKTIASIAFNSRNIYIKNPLTPILKFREIGIQTDDQPKMKELSTQTTINNLIDASTQTTMIEKLNQSTQTIESNAFATGFFY